MHFGRFPLVAVALTLIVVLAIAGCGSDDSSGGYGGRSAATASDGASGAKEAAVSVANVGDLGPILVDSKGHTLYDFHKDRGGKSRCYEACARVWPPLITEGAPQAKEGATASKLDVVQRRDGTTQVTYAGHPLYTYEADTQPGDAKGNDIDSFGAEWYALQPSGAEAEG
jgi:predicted lipoprotein with Yx(FWY)xxD motif